VVSDDTVTEEMIKKTVDGSGYVYRREVPGEDILQKRFAESRRKILLSLAVGIPLMVLMVVHMTGFRIPSFFIIESLAAGFILFVPGAATIRSAFIALRHGHTNMDTLISLSAFVSWLTALSAAAGLQHISFGTIAAMILTFHLGGRYIEARLKHLAARDVRALLDVQVKNARVLTAEGIEEVPVEAVKPGTVTIVRTGEKIPLDGKIIKGSCLVDESMITGEPAPVPRGGGEAVIGGTILRQGSIQVEVEKVGEDTFLAQMIKLVDEAQSTRVPLQALADRISFYFVPAIIILALLAGSMWYFFYPALRPILLRASDLLFWINPDQGGLFTGLFVCITVLVIACPCALGLATPMALVAGSGKAAASGILIKNGEALQASRSLRYMLMDKTGTLTRGTPEVVESSLSREELQPFAVLESHSIHPLAAALVEYAGLPREDIAVDDLEETAGRGISGTINGRRYEAGKPSEPGEYLELMEKGCTVVELRRDNEIEGWIAVTDPVRLEAGEVVYRLKEMGIQTVMLTGDNEATARSVASQIGIEEVIAGVSPDKKAEYVRRYRGKGLPVGMTGDGINDAAALKTADVGFAMGGGTDLSIESADIVLIRDNLETLAEAVMVSRRTVSKIKENLFWAFFYNLIALPPAMMGLLHPIIAETAMLFSSITVILNSLSIRKK
jgi:Cu+-exporting ATPase